MSEKKAVPQTTHDLYKMLIENGDLTGKIKFEDGCIFWYFKDFWIYTSLDKNEGYISINRNKKHWWQNDQLLHWHPMRDEIYENLCEIGNKDNILVIRNGCLFSDIFYLGKESGYKYSSGKKWHWGRLHYLKPKN